MSIRTERVASLIKEEIGSILEREYRGPSYGFMTVTEVKMSPDLRIARVSVSVFGDGQAKENAMRMLEEEKTHMRGILGSHLSLKFTPMLQFYLDDTMERVDRINTLLRKIHENDGDKGTRS